MTKRQELCCVVMSMAGTCFVVGSSLQRVSVNLPERSFRAKMISLYGGNKFVTRGTPVWLNKSSLWGLKISQKTIRITIFILLYLLFNHDYTEEKQTVAYLKQKLVF